MKRNAFSVWFAGASLGCLLLLAAGCASISENSYAYLGTPHYAPVDPAHVQILSAEPKGVKEKLGEIRLSIDGTPEREAIEKRLKTAAAKLGADAVFIVYDKMHIFPVVYADWWGPSGVSENELRNIVAIAVKLTGTAPH